VLDSSATHSAGRFLLKWASSDETKVSIELLSATGSVVESIELTGEDLTSPPVVGFTGSGAIGSLGKEEVEDTGGVFEADGDYPLCVTSSCIPVILSWNAPSASKVSIISDGKTLGDGLPSQGSLKVVEDSTKKYTQRTWLQGAPPGEFSDRTVEVRRYPSLSLVMEGTRFRRGNMVDFGASISCPAGDGGLKVTILTSDADVVPMSELTIPAGSTWMRTKVRLGENAGNAKVTATAPGYVRDGVTFIVE
jgi:hypothetical protein